MRKRRKGSDRSGFALALVVLMLFAIAIAGGAAYRIVSTELSLATGYRDSQEALTVARAGLERFLGEQIGVVGDSVSYAIGDGIATVTTRKIIRQDSLDDVYYVRSEGKVAEPRNPELPARRVVGTYAWHRMSPLPHKAALMGAMDWITLGGSSVTVDGSDHATSSDCPGGGTAGVAGAIAVQMPVVLAGTVNGNPARATYPSASAVIDSTHVRWDILQDPNFPVEFDGSPPDFGALPADSFPLVRYIGDLDAGSAWAGRGVLIVTGELRMHTGFIWDGIILAGSLGDVDSSDAPQVEGLLVGGLDGTDNSVTLGSGTFDYNSCDVYAADRALSYLDPIDHLIFEVN